MHFDAHQHFWHYSADAYQWITSGILAQDYLPVDLKPLLDATGFDGTVAVQARSTWEETRWLLTLAERNPWIVGVVGWADLCAPDLAEQLEYFATYPAFCGVRCDIETEPGSTEMPCPNFLQGMEVLTASGLAFDLLIRQDQLRLACRLAESAPEQRLILDHIAKPPIAEQVMEPWATEIRDLAANPNVACKVSGMVTEASRGGLHPAGFRPYLDVVFDAFGPERLMIGSDWPVCLQAASYGTTMQIVATYITSLGDDAQAAVLGGTAIEWYKLAVDV